MRLNRNSYMLCEGTAKSAGVKGISAAARFGRDMERMRGAGASELAEYACGKYSLVPEGGAYVGGLFSASFSDASGRGFANTVLSLSRLRGIDSRPFVAVRVSGDGNRAMLANSSFLEKASRSDAALDPDRPRGSFNGSDIMRRPGGIENAPENFGRLWDAHLRGSWDGNIGRISSANAAIAPRGSAFAPTAREAANLRRSVESAERFVSSGDYDAVLERLDALVAGVPKSLVRLACSEPRAGVRGKVLERLFASGGGSGEYRRLAAALKAGEPVAPESPNALADCVFEFDGFTCAVDVKTRIEGSESNPKGFNIDKYLRFAAGNARNVMMVFLVGISKDGGTRTCLCSVYDRRLLEKVFTSGAWSGGRSRGDVQFKGSAIDSILADGTGTEVDQVAALSFLNGLIKGGGGK